MFNLIQQFAHKAEMRESKDEILIGEILDTCTTPDEVAAAMRAEIEGLERGA